MRDLNFFLPYAETKKEFKSNYYFIIALFSMIVLYIIGTSSWYLFSSFSIKKDIKALNVELNDSTLIEKYKQAEGLNNKYNLMTKYSQGTEELIKNFQKKDIVSTDSINAILSCMPQDVFISSLNMNDTSIQLQCTSKSVVSAAEFQHNLIKLGKFKEVSISGIAGDAEKKNYGFTINCTLEGVDNNENKQK